MKLTERDLQQLYQQSTARKDATGCLDEETLLRAAGTELRSDERDRVIDHIAKCSDCAREYQIARDLRPLRSEIPLPARGERVAGGRVRGPLALAAVLVLALIGGMFWVQQRSNRRIATLEQQLAARRLDTAKVPLRPQFGTPILDLDADAMRGAPVTAAAVPAAPASSLFTLLLHLPTDIDGSMMLDIDGGQPQKVSAEDGVITVTLDRQNVGRGEHTINVRSSKQQAHFRFQVQ